MDDDTDDKDDTKRRSRNLSEKKRRDQFNMLINELSSMVSTTNRKMDKSTVLKSTIAFLKNHNELAVKSRAHEIQEDWKPPFLSNEEFTHLILEAVDGFIIVFSTRGHIIYVSGSITSLLGHLPSELMNGSMTIFDVVYEEDQATLYNILSNSGQGVNSCNIGKENQMEFSCHVRRGALDYREEPLYELVHFVGYFRSDTDSIDVDSLVSSTNRFGGDMDSTLVFVGTGRLDTSQLIREMTISDNLKTEFTSRHNLDWKFLALDSRATPIIGYVQLEVVGTSGYDYYHIDDLEKIVMCHEALMEKGEGTSCYYRFLTKGQQWVWLQTRFYISYHQWNSKPEFIVCTHRVVSYVDVMIQARKDPCDDSLSDIGINESGQKRKSGSGDQVVSSPWSSKSSVGKTSQLPHIEVASPGSVTKARSRHSYQGPGSDSASMSADSPGSRHSQLTTLSARTQRGQNSSNVRQPPTPTKPPPLSPAQASTTFIEPQHQYAVAAIPLQPIIGFPGTTVVTSLPTQELLRHPPTHLSDHVKRKQHELYQLKQILQQKEEELHQIVKKEEDYKSFLVAQGRYGVIPSLINVTVPYSVPGGVVSSTTHQPSSVTADMYVAPHSLIASPLTITTMSPSDIRPILQPANSSTESQSVNYHSLHPINQTEQGLTNHPEQIYYHIYENSQINNQLRNDGMNIQTGSIATVPGEVMGGQTVWDSCSLCLQGGIQNDQQSRSDSEVIPFQFSQQQAQLLFTNISSPNSH